MKLSLASIIQLMSVYLRDQFLIEHPNLGQTSETV